MKHLISQYFYILRVILEYCIALHINAYDKFWILKMVCIYIFKFWSVNSIDYICINPTFFDMQYRNLYNNNNIEHRLQIKSLNCK